MLNLENLKHRIENVNPLDVTGTVETLSGTVIEAHLPGASVGAVVDLEGVRAEVVGFEGAKALLVPLDHVESVRHGTTVRSLASGARFPVGDALLGRVIDPMGRALDEGPDPKGKTRPLAADPPSATRRTRIRKPVHTGVAAIDAFLTVGEGQRVAIMAGTGVGKSTLMGMLTRFSDVDVIVAALVGERGREVREFIEDQLGDALSRSVVVAATSDRPSVLQVRAVSAAMTVAEHFRDQGKRVLLVVDSLTRLAMAQRQIGLARGEPPTTRGYPPSVFSLIPALLERAGTCQGTGSITALCTVLIEGDDLQDPIGDLVRGVVDGHIVLSRRLADRGHFPAVDVLKSLSRTMPNVATPEHLAANRSLRRNLALWEENEELVRLGAYRKGSDPEIDKALAIHPRITAMCQQDATKRVPWDKTMAAMGSLG